MINYRAASAALAAATFAAAMAGAGTAAADSAPGGCAPASAVWQTTARESSYRHGPFILDANEWNPAGGGSDGTPASSMTTWAGHDSSWGVCTNQPGTGWPYPEERLTLPGTPMSSLSDISSTYDETTPPGGQWDSAYDIWLRRPAGAPGQSPPEVMIWTANHGEWTGNPQVVGDVTIAGHQYQMSVCGSCNRVTFMFGSDVPATTVNLLAVLRYAARNPASSKITGADPAITEIDRGWEIHKTDGTQAFTTNSYSLSVQQKPAVQRKPVAHHKPAVPELQGYLAYVPSPHRIADLLSLKRHRRVP